MGYVPDGTYDLTQRAIALVSGPGSTLADLKKFSNFLEDAQTRQLSRENLEKEVKDKHPKFTPLIDSLKPKSPSDWDIYFKWLRFIILSYLLSTLSLCQGETNLNKTPPSLPSTILVNNAIALASERSVPLMEMICDRTFQNENIQIDQHHYERCIFRNCKLIYRGGTYHLISCEFHNCAPFLDGPAGNTIQFMANFYKIGYRDQLEKLFEHIRQGNGFNGT